jgi:hypothetical protein
VVAVLVVFAGIALLDVWVVIVRTRTRRRLVVDHVEGANLSVLECTHSFQPLRLNWHTYFRVRARDESGRVMSGLAAVTGLLHRRMRVDWRAPTDRARKCARRSRSSSGGRVTIRGYVMFSNTAHGFGKLEIQPSALRLTLGPLTSRFLGALLGMHPVMTHRDRHVRVFCAVLGPPPFYGNTGVLLRSGPYGRSAVFVVNAWRRRRLLDSLREAGFEVVQQPTLMSVGHSAIRRRAR